MNHLSVEWLDPGGSPMGPAHPYFEILSTLYPNLVAMQQVIEIN